MPEIKNLDEQRFVVDVERAAARAGDDIRATAERAIAEVRATAAALKAAQVPALTDLLERAVALYIGSIEVRGCAPGWSGASVRLTVATDREEIHQTLGTHSAALFAPDGAPRRLRIVLAFLPDDGGAQ